MEDKELGIKVDNANSITGVHKYTGTLTFEFYGQPDMSTTDVFRYELLDSFKEDPGAMLEDIRWTHEPIEIVTWSKGRFENGTFVPDSEAA